MHIGIGIGRLYQRTNRCGCCIENASLVFLDHLPKASGIGECRYTLKHNLCSAHCQRTIGNIRVPCYPTNIRSTPEDIAWLDIKGPLHSKNGPQDISTRGMLYALWLTS